MIEVWEPDLSICPLNKRIHFLVFYMGWICECVGTLTTNMHTGGIIRGEVIEGKSKVFYEGELLYWKRYLTKEEFDAMPARLSWLMINNVTTDGEYKII